MSKTSDQGSAPNKTAAATGDKSVRRLRADELFGTSREVLIEHGSDVYRLRITSKDKLILTK